MPAVQNPLAAGPGMSGCVVIMIVSTLFGGRIGQMPSIVRQGGDVISCRHIFRDLEEPHPLRPGVTGQDLAFLVPNLRKAFITPCGATAPRL